MVDELLAHLDASPTPFHAVELVAGRLDRAGFARLDPGGPWSPEAARGSSYVVRDGAVVAWVGGTGERPGRGRFIGAHTDSPCLRVRPNPDSGGLGYRQVSVEVYGSPILATWADRDLGLAGRVVVRTGGGTEARLFRTDHAVLRVPLLAIHLDRDSNEGLRLDRQQHLQPVWALGDPRPGDVAAWLGSLVGAAPEDVLAWDASAFDLQPAALVGKDHELLTSARLDNQVSCFGALEALLARHADAHGDLAVVALFDHEEVGSATATGADGAWLAQVLERRALAAGDDRATWLEDLATSQMLSADMAHAVHPNYPERHEPGHRVRLGGGPVVKHNENARYATTATSSAAFEQACTAAGVPVQHYSHHGSLPCGSTIGPLTAAGLAVDTVDVGAPMLSMHSVREVMAAADVAPMVAAFTAWWGAPTT